MAMFMVMGTRQTRDGSWVGAAQLPIFKIEAATLNEAVALSAAVLSGGSEQAVHASVLESGGRDVYAFTATRGAVSDLQVIG